MLVQLPSDISELFMHTIMTLCCRSVNLTVDHLQLSYLMLSHVHQGVLLSLAIIFLVVWIDSTSFYCL